MAGDIVYRWSGQVIEPNDYMGFIGRNPGSEKRLQSRRVTRGQGMTHGTIAGNPHSGSHPRQSEADGKSSTTLARDGALAPEFVRENVNVAAQIRGLVTPGEVSSPDEIAPGSGAVMRQGTKKFAV
jgi:hypothetical protein